MKDSILKYESDVVYEVWRSGRNSDRVNYDRVCDHYYSGDDYSIAAAHEIRIQRQAQEQREIESQQQGNEYYSSLGKDQKLT